MPYAFARHGRVWQPNRESSEADHIDVLTVSESAVNHLARCLDQPEPLVILCSGPHASVQACLHAHTRLHYPTWCLPFVKAYLQWSWETKDGPGPLKKYAEVPAKMRPKSE